MQHYLFCNQIISSTVLLPELSRVAVGDPFFYFRLTETSLINGRISWAHQWRLPSGKVSISYARLHGAHLLRFPGLADFKITLSAKDIVCSPGPETPLNTLRHLLLDQVLPRCLAHQENLLLHASAVSLPGGVVLFVGSTGSGKSTIAGSFHQAGYPVISDDCVMILDNQDSVAAIPSYNNLRLWPDSREVLFPSHQEIVSMVHYADKERLQFSNEIFDPLGAYYRDEFPILGVFVLFSSKPPLKTQEMDLVKLPHRDAFIEMMQQTFLLDPSDKNQFKQLMKALGWVVPRVKVYKLNLPRDYNQLPQVRHIILDAV